MSDKLTVSGDGDDWSTFSRTPPNGKPIFLRSRAGLPHVHDFAEKGFFARLRCTLNPDDVTDAGLPNATEQLDAFEDALLGAIGAAGAQVYLIAITTGQGVRDFYFTASDKADLPKALKSIEGERPFTIALASGDPAPFLKTLVLSPEELEKAKFHGVPVERGGGGLLGKLFGG